MLTHLYIKNFVLIDKLDIDFRPGFSVITGETGAGKSIVLGAINLLLGQRADSKVMKNNEEKCVIEAHFDISQRSLEHIFEKNDLDYDKEQCIIRREITPNGKSRAYINDTPAPLATLKTIGEYLIDIHSQHKNLLINNQAFQLDVVDLMSNSKEILAEYSQLFHSYQKLQSAYQAHQERIKHNMERKDFLQFQDNELSQAQLIDGEQETLEQQAHLISHAEEIKQGLYHADALMSNDEHGIIHSIKSAKDALQSLQDKFAEIAPLCERLESCHIEIKDIAQEISTALDSIEYNPQELDRINARIDTIYHLEKKYHCNDIAALKTYHQEIQATLSDIENAEDNLQQMQQEIALAETKCRKLAEKMHSLRCKAAPQIQQQIEQRLAELGMPNATFSIHFDQTPLQSNGCDAVSFLFSANKNMPMQPVSQVASGGEIARVMLTIKELMSHTNNLPTIIFDEIDTGVSGKIAENMAAIMKDMGSNGLQVISITHLPQIAAMGNTHYKVTKTETATGVNSNMVMLSAEERVNEIAQMLSGSNVSDAAIHNAKELLRLS